MSLVPAVTVRLYQLQSDDLPKLADERALSRGRNLFADGGVSGARAQHNQLSARVQDRGTRAYQVKVSLDDTSAFAVCGCYQGGICEHAAAVLLAWTDNRALFTWSPPNNQALPLPSPAPDALWRGPRGTLRHLGELLMAQRVADLRKLAQRVGLEAEGEAKEVLVRQLTPVLANPERVAAALAEANSAQQHTLQALVLYDRGASPGELERVASATGGNSDNLDRTLKSLVGLGLAFTATPSAPVAPGWQVPPEWAPSIPPGPLPLAQPSQHSVRRGERELMFVTALRALCLLIEAQPLHANPATARSQFEQQNAVLNGWHNLPEEVEQLTRRSYGIFANEPIFLTMLPPPLPVNVVSFDELVGSLHQPPATVALMLRLLDQLKLLEVRNGKVHLAKRSDLLWDRSAVEQARLLTTTWANDLQWSEFHVIPSVRLRRHLQASYSVRLDQVYSDLASLRRAVVRVVRSLDPAFSFSVEGLVDGMRRIGPKLLFGDAAGGGGRIWQLADRHGGVIDPHQPSDWRLSVVPFVQQVLRQLHTLGLVTTDADVSVVQITGLGAHLLGLRAEYTPQHVGAVLTLESDHEVSVAAADADAPLLEQLDIFCERQGFRAGRFRYSLTPHSVRRMLLRGRPAEEIVSFLGRHSSGELPPSAALTIRKLAATCGQVQMYGNVALLELADDVLLAELMRATSLPTALIAQLSPRLLVIDPSSSGALWNELVTKGYTPQRVRPIEVGDKE